MTPAAIRKAAILLSSLEADAADALLEQLGPEDATRIRNALMELEDIDAKEQQQIIHEFLKNKPVEHPGVELSESLTLRMEAVAAKENSTGISHKRIDFHFLHHAPATVLANCLQNERPQMAALVISNLPATQAAEVLSHMESGTCGEIMQRIARLELPTAEILEELETYLQQTLKPFLNPVIPSQLSTLEAILQSSSLVHRAQFLRELDRSDAQLSRQLKQQIPEHQDPPPTSKKKNVPVLPPSHVERKHSQNTKVNPPTFSRQNEERSNRPRWVRKFSDFMQMDAEDLAELLAETEPQVFILALTGANPRIVTHLLQVLSAAAQKKILTRIENPGPVRLKEIEQAQQEMLLTANSLIEEGILSWPQATHVQYQQLT